MKYFIDCHVFDGMYQGSRTYIEGLYSSLIKQNIHDTFYLASYNTDLLRATFGKKKNIIYLKYFTRNKFLRLILNIPYLILLNKIDFAHFQYFVPFVKFCKEIVTIHDVLFLDFVDLFPRSYRIRNKIFFKYSAKRSDFLLTVSEYSKLQISKHFNIEEKKIHVIENGISNDFVRMNESTKSHINIKSKYSIDNYILYVSRIEPRKNHISLIRAFIEGEFYKNYFLIFIGKRDFSTQFIFDSIELLSDEIRKKIIFLENISYEELFSYYMNANLFVFPSIAEGFGIPPLEALYCGTSTICANNTAMTDFKFFKDRFFDGNNVSEMKDKMHFYINNKQNVPEISKYISENYNWDKIAVKFMKVIENK